MMNSNDEKGGSRETAEEERAVRDPGELGELEINWEGGSIAERARRWTVDPDIDADTEIELFRCESSLADRIANWKRGGAVQEATARHVAFAVVIVFGIAILLGVSAPLMVSFVHQPDDAALVTSSVVMPAYKGLADFSTTVFGPLLGFVLGYYFRERAPR